MSIRIAALIASISIALPALADEPIAKAVAERASEVPKTSTRMAARLQRIVDKAAVIGHAPGVKFETPGHAVQLATKDHSAGLLGSWVTSGSKLGEGASIESMVSGHELEAKSRYVKVSPKGTTMFTRTETKLFPGVRFVHRFEERRAGIFGDRIATRESKHLEIGNRKIKLPVLLKH